MIGIRLGILRTTAFVISLFISISFFNPTWAQTSEAQLLGTKIAHQFLSHIDIKGRLLAGLTGLSDASAFPQRPEWNTFLRDSFIEEIAQNGAEIDSAVGNGIARTFTVQELRAGSAFLDSPGGQALLAHTYAESRKQPNPPMSIEARKAIRKFMTSPEGVSISEKIKSAGETLKPIEGDLMGAILPGVMIRFAEKIKADEAARRIKSAELPTSR